MRPLSIKPAIVAFAMLVSITAAEFAHAELKAGWDGKRRISYQQQKDLF